MSNVTEKLVLLALASENVDEAVSALKKARKMQPSGKLEITMDTDQAALLRERMQLQIDREAFEDERRAYQKRILAGDEEIATRSRWRGLGAYAHVLGKSAAVAALTLAILGGAGYGAVSVGGPASAGDALAARICAAVGSTALLECLG